MGVRTVLQARGAVRSKRFPPRRRCVVEGALLEEFLVTAFLAPLLDADLRAQPHLQVFATDASPQGTPVSLELWTRLFDFPDEKGCSVRLDWDMNSTLPLELRDSRAAVAGLVVDLLWVERFSYRFRYPQQINLTEMEVLINLIRGPAARVCSVWSTAKLFLDQCARVVPAADV